MIGRFIRFVFANIPLLLLGAVAGLVWANLAPEYYHRVSDLHLSAAGHAGAWRGMDLRYLVNDVLMSLFFALVGKQVWEALLPGGSLNNPRRAATPVLCAIGGMAAPAAIYLALAALSGRWAGLRQGWAIPARRTSPSATSSRGWSSARSIRRRRSCCCWPSRTMRWG